MHHRIGIIVNCKQKKHKVICLDNIPNNYPALNLKKTYQEHELEVRLFATNLCNYDSKKFSSLLTSS